MQGVVVAPQLPSVSPLLQINVTHTTGTHKCWYDVRTFELRRLGVLALPQSSMYIRCAGTSLDPISFDSIRWERMSVQSQFLENPVHRIFRLLAFNLCQFYPKWFQHWSRSRSEDSRFPRPSPRLSSSPCSPPRAATSNSWAPSLLRSSVVSQLANLTPYVERPLLPFPKTVSMICSGYSASWVPLLIVAPVDGAKGFLTCKIKDDALEIPRVL